MRYTANVKGCKRSVCSQSISVVSADNPSFPDNLCEKERSAILFLSRTLHETNLLFLIIIITQYKTKLLSSVSPFVCLNLLN
jgi:hypothetical protein